jgi:membrane protease YdiL (CAAX protease family)
MTASATSSKRFSITTSILLSIIAFALWQIYDLIMLYTSPPITLILLLFLAIPAITLAIFVLFTRLAKSTLGKQGFKKPTTLETSKVLLLSMGFIAIYILIYLFPAFSTGDFFIRGISTDPFAIIHRVASAILISLAAESVFRGYVFRNLTRNHGFFTSLYASSILFALYQISIKDVIGSSLDQIVTYAFTNVLPSFAAGLFLGYFFYKIGWSLLGPAVFLMGVRFFLDPLPIVSPGSSPYWWMAITLDATSYIILIFIVDSLIKEPRYLRRRYGFETRR